MALNRFVASFFAAGLGLAACCYAQARPGFGYQALVRDAKTRIREVNTGQLKAMIQAGERLLLVDVREDKEWDAGRAAKALHIGRGVLEREIEVKAPDKSAKIVLYCGGGFRSALAADTLQKMGYTNVFSLAGGMGAYTKAGLPVEKPPVRRASGAPATATRGGPGASR